MRHIVVLLVIAISSTLQCQLSTQPLTHEAACHRFRDAIVQISAYESPTKMSYGTGFITDPGGFIVTAMHVVADRQNLVKYESIRVIIHGFSHEIPAEIVSPLDDLTSKRDLAILKIDKTNLRYLELGNESIVEDGSPVAIIGFPLSAPFPYVVPYSAVPKFCLSGTVSAQGSFPLGNLEFIHTIYFQGVSIKGISGAPIISLAIGKVIGIVDTRMTGISRGLEEAGIQLETYPRGAIAFGSLELGTAIHGLIDTLSTQLANGLGTGSGATDAANLLTKTKRDYAKKK